MVKTLLRSSLREIRQSMGRYVAILAIVALGVGFFSGLRMSEPDMKATGIAYLEEQRLYDIRLLSTLGFTEEDVTYFSDLDSTDTVRGAVYTEFLYLNDLDEDEVLMAHSLTEGINEPRLRAGRMPEQPNECLGDVNYFSEGDIGKTIRVSPDNDEDTLELLAYDEYTLVGIATSPNYLNYERGSASIGNGSVSAFLLIPEEGFEFDAYYEIFLHLKDMAEPYSDTYEDQIDAIQPELETLAEERGQVRYTTLYDDATEEIQDGEQ
ncbi:MAG: ABC transporter permease, partial [Oscillospiraceae bacterium]|nr:ABC transporter permease [Oscillospiraceae bacterium]